MYSIVRPRQTWLRPQRQRLMGTLPPNTPGCRHLLFTVMNRVPRDNKKKNDNFPFVRLTERQDSDESGCVVASSEGKRRSLVSLKKGHRIRVVIRVIFAANNTSIKFSFGHLAPAPGSEFEGELNTIACLSAVLSYGLLFCAGEYDATAASSSQPPYSASAGQSEPGKDCPISIDRHRRKLVCLYLQQRRVTKPLWTIRSPL